MDIKEKVKKFPLSSGVYIIKSSKGKILYVGKASSLRKRVSSYFSRTHSVKNSLLLERLSDIEYVRCESPEQALILEAALIKEKKPKYNVALRDNKSYPYVEITREQFPRIFISRLKSERKNILFGPYPKVEILRLALELIRRSFPYRSCRTMPKTTCLFFHLKLCPAPCINKISFVDYKANIESISKILGGERQKLIRALRRKMKQLSARNDFEKAAKIRDRLLATENLYKGKPREHEIISLKDILNLPSIPLVIEAIDVSSFGNKDSVGSVVVFKDASADKSSYRRFLIKESGTKDDYAMVAEVVKRRYSRLVREKHKLPDLIVIDGGKGHVVRAARELKYLRIPVSIIGIAKRNEEIWLPLKKSCLRIPKDSPALHLIQRVRDEAHRFAHSYQIVRRKKK